MASYTKLRDGSWGVKGLPSEIAPGKAVTVTKRDGTKKSETVGKILWTGDGTVLATITRDESTERKPSRKSRGRRTGCSCGSIEGEYHDWYCQQCRFDELDM